jgi:hypothetical protein
MDTARFTTLVRSLSPSPSRRATLRLLAGSALGGLLPLSAQPSDARKKGGKRKKKKRGGETPLVSPTPPRPTCTDTVKNGSETDVDCGGTCPRCSDGKACLGPRDCTSAFCANTTCQICTESPNNCGADSVGPCECRTSSLGQTCLRMIFAGSSCSQCPSETEVCFAINISQDGCFVRCGTS